MRAVSDDGTRASIARLCLRQHGLSAHPTRLSTVWNGCVTGENEEVWPLPRLLKLSSRTLHVCGEPSGPVADVGPASRPYEEASIVHCHMM